MLFNWGCLINIYLLRARSRIHVILVIFSFIIKCNAELKTVFSIWACNPLKKPSGPSLFHMAYRAPKIVFLVFLSTSLLPSSSKSAAWIMTLHLGGKLWPSFIIKKRKTNIENEVTLLWGLHNVKEPINNQCNSGSTYYEKSFFNQVKKASLLKSWHA